MAEFRISVESPEALQRAQLKGVQDVLRAPQAIGAAQWCYDRLKRSTSKVRLEASFFGKTEFEQAKEYQKLVDLLKADSLISCAVLAFEEREYAVTFRNGTVISFT